MVGRYAFDDRLVGILTPIDLLFSRLFVGHPERHQVTKMLVAAFLLIVRQCAL